MPPQLLKRFAPVPVKMKARDEAREKIKMAKANALISMVKMLGQKNKNSQ